MARIKEADRRWEERTFTATRGERRSNKDTLRILDVCPATVAMPNPLLDPRAAQASETTEGGFGTARSLPAQVRETSEDGDGDFNFSLGCHCSILREMRGSLLSSVVKYRQAGPKLKSSVRGLPV